MDLTKYPSRGDYELEGLDFSYVKLSSSPTDDLVLVYPSEEIKLELLNAIANQKSQAAKDEELKKRKDEAEAEVAEFEASEASDLDHAAELEQISDAIEKEIADTRKSVRRHLTSLASKNVTVLTPGTEVTYGKIQVSDPAIKFAVRDPPGFQAQYTNGETQLSKRLRALTGLRISDPQLYNSRTLSDILSQFIAATKSKPTKVFEKVQLQTELPRLPNVKLHSRQIREEEKERAIGRWKVIEYALTERGLPVYKHEAEDYAPSNDMLRPAAWTVPEPKLVPKPKKVKVLKH